jgi:hypothetical protein
MGDWLQTLQLADRSIRHLQWGRQQPYLAGVLNVVARAIANADIEAAARLQGAAVTWSSNPPPAPSQPQAAPIPAQLRLRLLARR